MGWLDRMSPWAAVGFGAFMQPWSLVAIGAATVVQAKLSTVGDWLALVMFCLLATSSFLVMELYAAMRPEAAEARLGRVRTWIDSHMDQAIIIGSLALGGLLLADSIFLIVDVACRGRPSRRRASPRTGHGVSGPLPGSSAGGRACRRSRPRTRPGSIRGR